MFEAFVLQEDPTPVPEVSPNPNCIRVDPRVSPDYSQRCTAYNQNSHLTHGFLFPPGKATPPGGRSLWNAYLNTSGLLWVFFWLFFFAICRVCNVSAFQIRSFSHHQHCSHVPSLQKYVNIIKMHVGILPSHQTFSCVTRDKGQKRGDVMSEGGRADTHCFCRKRGLVRTKHRFFPNQSHMWMQIIYSFPRISLLFVSVRRFLPLNPLNRWHLEEWW